jgi:hypothetical protein
MPGGRGASQHAPHASTRHLVAVAQELLDLARLGGGLNHHERPACGGSAAPAAAPGPPALLPLLLPVPELRRRRRRASGGRGAGGRSPVRGGPTPQRRTLKGRAPAARHAPPSGAAVGRWAPPAGAMVRNMLSSASRISGGATLRLPTLCGAAAAARLSEPAPARPIDRSRIAAFAGAGVCVCGAMRVARVRVRADASPARAASERPAATEAGDNETVCCPLGWTRFSRARLKGSPRRDNRAPLHTPNSLNAGPITRAPRHAHHAARLLLGPAARRSELNTASQSDRARPASPAN